MNASQINVLDWNIETNFKLLGKQADRLVKSGENTNKRFTALCKEADGLFARFMAEPYADCSLTEILLRQVIYAIDFDYWMSKKRANYGDFVVSDMTGKVQHQAAARHDAEVAALSQAMVRVFDRLGHAADKFVKSAKPIDKKFTAICRQADAVIARYMRQQPLKISPTETMLQTVLDYIDWEYWMD